jgi:hypothetical protein
VLLRQLRRLQITNSSETGCSGPVVDNPDIMPISEFCPDWR